MKKHYFLLVVFLLLFLLSSPASAGDKPSSPEAGDSFPAVHLSVPDNPEHRSYLGISGDGESFALNSIKTDILVIEIFSMYCPYCQREAPEVNALYENIEKSRELDKRIKIIGIGAGNSLLEVDTFRNAFDVAFPLFPDRDYKIYEKLGEVRTPYFFAVDLEKEKTGRVIYSELGGLNGAQGFLARLLKLSGEKSGD